MAKFKYDIYDYSKVGIDRVKVYHRHVCDFWEMDIFKRLKYSENEYAEIIFKELKRRFEENMPSIYKYSPNFDFIYEIIFPEKTYIFNETSNKKE